MIDLETLDVRASAVVVSVGAVKFNPETGELGDELHVRLCIDGQLQVGRTIGERTLMWWMEQSDAARAVFQEEAPPCYSGLVAIKTFIPEDAVVWGNGAEFDNAILASLFNAHGIQAPWKHYNSRCYRTLKNMYPHVEKPEPRVEHNALDDARAQALHLLAIFAEINKVAKAA